MQTRRITVEEVRAAYRKTGLRPWRGAFHYEDEKCACALGAVFFATGGKRKGMLALYAEEVTEHLKLDEFYQAGFIKGFDNQRAIGDEPYYLLGYTDGQACAAAVFGEGDGGE